MRSAIGTRSPSTAISAIAKADRQHRGAAAGEAAGGELPLDLEADHQEEDGQQPVVDPLAHRQAEGDVAGDEADRQVPQTLERCAPAGVGQQHREQRHQEQQQAGGWRPAGEVERRRLHAMAGRALQRLRQCRFIPGAFETPVVDEEGG
jgi:hypothetical protein